jgi:hypothetical protein
MPQAGGTPNAYESVFGPTLESPAIRSGGVMKPDNCTENPEQRATINPYFYFGHKLFSRILWDLHLRSWVSRRRIKIWKDRFKNGRAIILCNGPSLNHVDFEQLHKKDIFCFGLNKISLIFNRTLFRPSVIVAVNPYVIFQHADYYNSTHLPLFLDYRCQHLIKFRKNIHFLHAVPQLRKMARDCSISVVEGATVTFVAIQLAFHMGFIKVALVGCDHSFSHTGPANKTVISASADWNHFDSRYFANGAKWQLPDLLASEVQYDTARQTFERYGRKLVNCTVGGHLEVFHRMPLREFFEW